MATTGIPDGGAVKTRRSEYVWGCIILNRKLGHSQRLATCRYLQGRGSWQRAWLDKLANSIITSDDEQSGDNCELTEPADGDREGDVAIGGANVDRHSMERETVNIQDRKLEYKRSFKLTYIQMSCTVQSHTT